MGYAAPSPSEMFSDASGPEVARRFEQYKTVLSESHKRSASGNLAFVPKEGIVAKAPGTALAERVETITKALPADTLASIQGELDAVKGVIADLGKDLSVGSPLATGLVPYDLEAPAKLLVPRETPLRNSLPRQPGRGTGRQFKRITGWTNSGTGGVADAMAFMNSESVQTAFGGLNLRRGAKINYAADEKTVAYVEQGLSDMVTWRGQFAGMGFQDLRQLSHTALLWASLGAEERSLLYARGASSNGYAGPVSAPSGVTAVAAGTGGAIAAGTYSVKVTARAGGGESVASGAASVTTSGSTSTITVTVGTEPTGALGYNVYVGTSGSEVFQTSFSGNKVVLTALVTGTAAVPGADSTANANGYDGFLTVQSDPAQSGYFKRVNASISTGSTPVGDGPFQDAFVSLYGADTGATQKRLANPDEIWVDGQVRRALGDFLRQAGSSAYRIMLTEGDATGGARVGSVVNGIANEVTGKMVDLSVHPYIYPGNALIRSRTLPVPDSEISNTAEVTCVQDYMAVDWPVVQFTYDQSTYWFSTLVHYAPGWSGMLVGLLV